MKDERAFSRALRERHAGVEPDPSFVARVVAALPRTEWTLGWAARRVLPASLAVAVVLSVAVVMTRDASRTAPGATSQSASDPLDWLLETGR